MKKIIFDLSVCQPIGKSVFHGGGVYGYIVLKKLVEKYPGNISVYYNSTRFLPHDISDIIKSNNIDLYDSNELSLSQLWDKGVYSKLYSPLYSKSYDTLMKNNVPLMVTIHGLRALEMNRDSKEQMYADSIKEYLKAIIKKTFIYNFLTKKYYLMYNDLLKYKNGTIITVSEHSKASIKYFYPYADVNRIKVIYSPNTTQLSDSNENAVSERYYLIVSANRWIKNAYRAIKAFDRVFDIGYNFKVYIVGIDKDHKIVRKLNNKNKFRFFEYLDRNEYESILKKAYCLVYPTLNEGFGYPPLECMKYKVPVIASAISSIPEICQDGVSYCNPYSIDEIANRILQMENIDYHNIIGEKGYNRFLVIKNKQDSDLNNLVEQIIS